MTLLKKTHIIFAKVIPFVVILVLLKLLIHHLEWEFIPLNAIFSGIIGANVFLMGFLLSGVLSDYKESEKMPGDLAAIIATMADEMEIIFKTKKDPAAREALSFLYGLILSLEGWLYKREKTRAIMAKIRGLNDSFISLEHLTQANFIARLKQEQNSLRRLVIRIHTIRETDFISSGYLIAISTSVLLLLGLIFSRIEPFYESLFFVGVITYLLVFLLFLIRDLDNPFGHYEFGSSEDVSLKPIEDMIKEIRERLDGIGGIAS